MPGFTRRQLLGGLAGLGGAVLAGPGMAAPGSGASRGSLPPFSPEQRRTLAAAVDRILPGAVEAGVPEYLDAWLGTRPFRRVRAYLAEGAARLEAVARDRYGRPFAACSGKEQDAILAGFAAARRKERGFDRALFFRQLMELTLEGYLSDPVYGGNRDQIGWRFIGMPEGFRSCWWNPRRVDWVLAPGEGLED